MDRTFLQELAKGFGVVAILAGFLRYFMLELKEVRKQMDDNRAEDAATIRDLMERVIRMEERSRETLQNVSDSNKHLADAVNNITSKFSSN